MIIPLKKNVLLKKHKTSKSRLIYMSEESGLYEVVSFGEEVKNLAIGDIIIPSQQLINLSGEYSDYYLIDADDILAKVKED